MSGISVSTYLVCSSRLVLLLQGPAARELHKKEVHLHPPAIISASTSSIPVRGPWAYKKRQTGTTHLALLLAATGPFPTYKSLQPGLALQQFNCPQYLAAPVGIETNAWRPSFAASWFSPHLDPPRIARFACPPRSTLDSPPGCCSVVVPVATCPST